MTIDEWISRFDNEECDKLSQMEQIEIKDMLIKLKERKGKCKWGKYDYRTVCPKEHDIDNPYWRIPENYKDVLKYCPYCGKEIDYEWEHENDD